jgi:hypothetical protein
MATAVRPTFFQGDQVLVGMVNDAGRMVHPRRPSEEDAFGIFWMAGGYDGTPAEFVKKEMAEFGEAAHVVFDGTATFRDGRVVFDGRALRPFSDVRHAFFMLVREHRDEGDIEDWNPYPVVIRRANHAE